MLDTHLALTVVLIALLLAKLSCIRRRKPDLPFIHCCLYVAPVLCVLLVWIIHKRSCHTLRSPL